MSELEIEIVDDNAEIEIDAVDSDVELQFEIDATSGGTDDYEKLNNLPKINGTTLKGNYNEIDPTVPAWAKADTKPTYTAEEVGALPDDTVIPEVPTNVSAFVNDSGYLTEETDPTVPQWAKASSKPTYSASEVGALPSDTFIPSKVSDLTNDSGFITTESDPTVPSWAKQETKPSYTAEEVGALPNTTQIPSKVSDLTNDSDFQTATEVSQTVADAVGQITSFDYAIVNELPASGVKGTIYLVHKADEEEQNVYAEYLWINNAWESIGDTKVDMSDYTKTEDLAAVALSNKSSDLTNDAGFIASETDPTVPSWAKQSEKPSYTASEVGALPDTTVIPTVPTNVSAFTNDSGYLVDSDISDVIRGEDVESVTIDPPTGGTHYSTEEQIIGTWIDGKPLYRKVIVIQKLTMSTEQQFVTIVDTTCKIVGANGAVCWYNENLIPTNNFPFNFTNKNGRYICVDTNNNTLRYFTNSGGEVFGVFAIIEYIKTTD